MPYDSLNVGQHVGDIPEIVSVNRTLLPEHQNITWLNQTHSTHCIELSGFTDIQFPVINADASFTRKSGPACAVMTADCLPILLCDKAGTFVAAIHAGWRGLADGIIENTLNKISSPGHKVMAWLGPAISQAYFEVGTEVKQSFPEHQTAFKSSASSAGNQKKFMGNLYQIAREKLQACGVSNTYGGDFCTYTQETLFFSHRRASHQQTLEKNVRTGRMVSCIYME